MPSPRTALILHREVRQIHATKAYWSWLVAAADLDVFVLSPSMVQEKDGTAFAVDEAFFRRLFGRRLKLCIILEDHPDLMLEREDVLERMRLSLPRCVVVRAMASMEVLFFPGGKQSEIRARHSTHSLFNADPAPHMQTCPCICHLTLGTSPTCTHTQARFTQH